MKPRLRGAAIRVGDWIHEREILGDGFPLAPGPADLEAARAGLLKRLGIGPPQAPELGDLLVAGRGFGLGTRSDYAPLLLRTQGFSAVLAESVDPRFRASALRLGLPVLPILGLGAAVAPGDELIVSLENAAVENLRTRRYLMGTAPTSLELRLLAEAPGLELLGRARPEPIDPDVLELTPTAPRERTPPGWRF